MIRPLAFAAALATMLSPAAAEPVYTITDLGVLPGYERSRAIGINDKAQVIAYCDTASSMHSFLWDKGKVTDVAPPTGFFKISIAFGINDRGQVVGDSHDENGYVTFLWQDGKVTDLRRVSGNHEFNHPTAINNRGQIVGHVPLRAFLMEGGGLTDLAGLSKETRTFANAINEAGQIVGFHANEKAKHAFLWERGKMTDLGDLPGGRDSSEAHGINDRGQVVGMGMVADGEHAFLWEDGKMTDLGSLWPGDQSRAFAINDSGQIVGVSRSRGRDYALLWDNGKLYDLERLLVPGTRWRLSEARGINASGQIVGTGLNPDGKSHAFLLTPVPAATN